MQESVDIYYIVVVPAIFMLAVLMLMVFIRYVWIPFSYEHRFIRSELARCDEKERWYWKRQLKKLYISYIPIIGGIIRRKKRWR